MATKQDFEATARIIRRELDICAGVLGNADADPEASERAYGAQTTLQRIARAFADDYAQNGRFDRGRFYGACGLNVAGHVQS